jgi:hypothetical protein
MASVDPSRKEKHRPEKCTSNLGLASRVQRERETFFDLVFHSSQDGRQYRCRNTERKEMERGNWCEKEGAAAPQHTYGRHLHTLTHAGSSAASLTNARTTAHIPCRKLFP